MAFVNKKMIQIITLITLVAGIFLRFYHLLRFDFLHAPFRLGGLFVAFAEQILENDFRLPVTIPFYSEGGIPFAYPPLGFYVEALLMQIFPGSHFVIANLLPPIVSSLALPGVFLLLRWYFSNREAPVLAGVFAYAFLPLAFANQIEAAGLAESFGSLAMVVFFYAVIRYRRLPDGKNALWVGLALAFSVISSPGSAIGAAFLAGLLGLETVLKNRFSWQSIWQMALTAGAGLLVSAPYWLTVMLNHGNGIFILPVLGQYNGGGEKRSFLTTLFERLMNFTVVQDGGVFFWNLVIFLGLLWLVLHGKFTLPLAFLVLFSIPRESAWLTALPAALLFAHGFVEVLLSLLQPIFAPSQRLRAWGMSLILLFLGGWLAFQSFALSNALLADQQWKISAEQVKLVEDARAMIPADAKVLVLGNDALLEWSPYLLEREVINTKFGLEWQPAKLERVTHLNKQLENAATWEAMLKTITEFTGQPGIYVLSADKKYLTALNRASELQITLKLETPEIQLGILGKP